MDYAVREKQEILLCGLQEYVEGEILDPWRLSIKEPLKDMFTS